MVARWFVAVLCCFTGVSPVFAADWPTHLHDNRRSGATPEKLDTRRLAPAWDWRSPEPPLPAWSGPARWDAYAGHRNLPSMRNYDPVFHVTAAGGSIFFGSSVDDAVHCLDARTGKARWTVTTDGPIRIAPTFTGGRVYFGSDDGFAYCLVLGVVVGTYSSIFVASPALLWLSKSRS